MRIRLLAVRPLGFFAESFCNCLRPFAEGVLRGFPSEEPRFVDAVLKASKRVRAQTLPVTLRFRFSPVVASRQREIIQSFWRRPSHLQTHARHLACGVERSAGSGGRRRQCLRGS